MIAEPESLRRRVRISGVRSLAGAVVPLLILGAVQQGRAAEVDGGLKENGPQRQETDEAPLRVGVAGEPPGVIASRSGAPYGLAVQYWEEVAGSLGLQYRLARYPSTEAALAALADGGLDLVGDISITADRIARFDFTQPGSRSATITRKASPPPTSEASWRGCGAR